MTDLLTLSCLGPTQISLARSPQTKLNGEKLSALLFYLAMKAGHRLRREYLAELLWPDLPLEAARSNLRHAYFKLRQLLDDDENEQPFLLSGREWLSFNPNSSYRLDAHEISCTSIDCPAGPLSASCQPCLARLEKAAGLYHGEFMSDVDLPHCDEFSDWQQAEREAIRRRTLALMERLSICHEQNQGHGKAMAFAQRYLELEPWNEEGHRRVMRLYALSDQASAALSQYESCCKMLKMELGVLPSGETQKLAESIRNGQFRPHPPTSTANHPHNRRATDAIEAPSRVPRAALPAELHQATVLYCELTHAGDEDIDEAMLLLQTPQDRCVEIIRKLSGHLVTTHGGGLLAYFGYPKASEDAATLAVQAALAAIRESTAGIEIRAGVHTGVIITSGDLSLPDVVGKTSRLAIQLRQVARPGEVAISEKTHQLISDCFDCEVLPGRSFSGMDRSSNIYRVVRERGIGNQLEAVTRLTPMTGRQDEISALLKLWNSSIQSYCHTLLIQGDPGIGKSRLIHSFKELLKDEPHTVRALRCFPEFSLSPFHPVIAALDSILDIEPSDTCNLRLMKLSRFLQTHFPEKMTVALPILANLLSLPPHDASSPSSPPVLKEQLQTVLLELLHTQASRRPLLLVVEDVHWIDPSTNELLNLLISKEKSHRILILLTARTEYTPKWESSLYQKMVLQPVSKDSTQKIIKSLDSSIPNPIIRQIVERSCGIPLFTEEITRMIIKDHHVTIPLHLDDLLSMRLDGMGEAKRIAQLAACIGLEFEISLLNKISPLDAATQERVLFQLMQSGMIVMIDKARFRFRHTVMQESAYQSQSVQEKRDSHLRIAQSLRVDFPHITTNYPELLAQHYEKAGNLDLAIEFFSKAGQQALKSHAHTEAVEHFHRGLALIENLSTDQARYWMEFELLCNLGTVLITIKGHDATETKQIHRRAMEVSKKLNDRFVSSQPVLCKELL